jgi:hexosaminidase
MLTKFVLLLNLSALFAVGAASYPPLVPLPYLAQLGETSISLDGSFHFVTPTNSNTVISNAISRYTSVISVPKSSVGTLKSCSLKITDSDTTAPIVGSDESHQIDISTSGVCSITAVTTWGLLHGIETLTQLLTRDSSSNVQLTTAPVSITDYPRFSHRGMMIDTARHYLSVESIRGVIDSLPMSKFNVLHWHTVDAESFPLKVW